MPCGGRNRAVCAYQIHIGMPGARTDCNSDKRLLSPPGHICYAASPKFTSVIISNGKLRNIGKNKAIQIKWVPMPSLKWVSKLSPNFLL
jgi:hypothetical protein